MSIFEIGTLLAIFTLLSRLKSLKIDFDDAPIWKKLIRHNTVIDPFAGTTRLLDQTDAPKLVHRSNTRKRTRQAPR